MIHIGFLGNSFRRHSCGYLLRWLLLGLEKEATFSFFNLGFPANDELACWFEEQGIFYQLADNPLLDTIQIIADAKVDVLIDIDGPSFPRGCVAIAILKYLFSNKIPTISWMGFSPSGMCEYAIGDSQLIPAPEIYSEKVLNLPDCYISSGGFDVDIPEFKRSDFGFPDDATIYYFCQKPIKSNEMVVLAINEIMKKTPDSRLLLKTFVNEEGNRSWLENLDFPERVSFLPCSKLEENARANLALVDVMLDSFPYNGTLTTLESLWMGVPVVSRYGQRWASRQGKTLLHQMGLPTFPDWQGYIDYAVQLGNNPELLAQTKQQIRDSKASSPLWNYQQHAKDFLSALESIL